MAGENTGINYGPRNLFSSGELAEVYNPIADITAPFASPAYANGSPQFRADTLLDFQNQYSGINSSVPAVGSNVYPKGETGYGGFDLGNSPGPGYSTSDVFELSNLGVPEVNKKNGFLKRMGDGEFGSLEGWGSVLGGLGDLGTAYMAYKNYGLSRKQFDFSKEYANRNLANQASIVNADLAHRAAARNSFAGNNRHTAARVDGSRIG